MGNQPETVLGATPDTTARSYIGCEICQFALHKVEKNIQGDLTYDKVKKNLDQLCKTMPHAVQGQCVNLMKIYEPLIIKAFLQGKSASAICFEINLCLPEGIEEAKSLDEETGNKCALCEYAMTTLEGMITDKKNEDQIRKGLEKLCKYLPDSLTEECDDFVVAYTDKIIHMMIDDYTPDKICQALKLCDPSQPEGIEKAKSLEFTDVGDETCVLCEYVIKTLDQIIMDKNNQK